MRSLIYAAVASSCVAGCATPGLLYTDVTRPLTLDMRETPLTETFALGTQSAFREPLTRAGLTAEWSSAAPGLAARESGIEAIHYADIRRQSILGGLWGKTTILVYGTDTPEPHAAQGPEVSAR